jgi:hypothetical protein
LIISEDEFESLLVKEVVFATVLPPSKDGQYSPSVKKICLSNLTLPTLHAGKDGFEHLNIAKRLKKDYDFTLRPSAL